MGSEMLTILLGVTTFAVVVVGLTAVLMVAKAKLVNSGDVRIIINEDEDNALVVPAGSNLLNTLANQKIFLPSACGGMGSCGVCKVHGEGLHHTRRGTRRLSLVLPGEGQRGHAPRGRA